MGISRDTVAIHMAYDAQVPPPACRAPLATPLSLFLSPACREQIRTTRRGLGYSDGDHVRRPWLDPPYRPSSSKLNKASTVTAPSATAASPSPPATRFCVPCPYLRFRRTHAVLCRLSRGSHRSWSSPSSSPTWAPLPSQPSPAKPPCPSIVAHTHARTHVRSFSLLPPPPPILLSEAMTPPHTL